MRHPAPRCATPSESVMVSGPGAIVSGVPLKSPLSEPHGAGPLMPMSWERAVGQSKREWARIAECSSADIFDAARAGGRERGRRTRAWTPLAPADASVDGRPERSFWERVCPTACSL